MTYTLVCPVNDNQVIVSLPPDFRSKKQVTVVVDDHVNPKAQKLERLKFASKDPLFLADIIEIQKDFNTIDHETI